MSNDPHEDPLQALEQALGYAFKDRALLVAALTHRSFLAERRGEGCADNQRLEFLGDAVFGLLSAEWLYARHAAEDEGSLTIRRSQVASGRALAEAARAAGLGAHLRLGRPDEAAGGRDKGRLLADALEAVFGAAWCDGGLPAARAVFERLAAGRFGERADPWADNPKGLLQEVAQRHAWAGSPEYELLASDGPPHEPVYTVRARVEGGREARGEGRTKRAAEVAAARALLAALKGEGLA